MCLFKGWGLIYDSFHYSAAKCLGFLLTRQQWEISLTVLISTFDSSPSLATGCVSFVKPPPSDRPCGRRNPLRFAEVMFRGKSLWVCACECRHHEMLSDNIVRKKPLWNLLKALWTSYSVAHIKYFLSAKTWQEFVLVNCEKQGTRLKDPNRLEKPDVIKQWMLFSSRQKSPH